jgi:ketosteroid isomerase-like protein
LILSLLLLAAAIEDRAADIAALREAKLNAWPGYYRANDPDGLAAFLADGFVALSDDGSSETKAEVVAWVRANKWAGGSNGFRYDIKDIAFYSENIANVYGVGSFDGKAADGSACRMRYTSANIFVREGGRWKPKFSHTSKAACAAKDS